MIDRIQELAQQAGFGLHRDGEIYTSRLEHLPITEDIQKFAELIVRECIEQASISNGHGNNQWDKALTFAADNIKKHFGVEE